MKSITYDTEESIISFLEDLIFKYKHNMLSEDEKKRVSEFYIKEKFIDSMDMDINMDINIDINIDKDLIKYMVMGWHIYQNIEGRDQ
jgi:hypothetical protein